MKYSVVAVLLFFTCQFAFGQESNTFSQNAADSLKREILAMRTDIDNIQLNLGKTQQRFKWGLLTATIGYSVTIAGGQLLANGNVDSGRVLLYTGGGIGLVGTALLVDSFKYLKTAAGKHSRKGFR